MAREIKIGSYVQVIADNDSGMLVGRKGIVSSIDRGNYYWVKFDNHRIPLPFGKDEIKAANKKRAK